MRIMFTWMSEHAVDYTNFISALPADKRNTTIKNVIAVRDAEHITRPDMIQLMMDNKGKEDRIQLDIDDMIAQAYVFYFGGFETSLGVMSFTAHQLMANLSVQMKLRQEIDKFLDESNRNLEYLDAVIKEALRLLSASVLERVCNRAFELPPALPGKKPFIVDKGMIIWILIYAVHHDEKYYDDPEKFRPERFLVNKLVKHVVNHDVSFYFPFGLGLKICIGKRFGTLMNKIVLFHLLA
ncbi:Cytochrome P450 9e2 [Temnothorax longispinosus]|uniref:Cytochrome P450 9e2 n=1 Tax=Temnothorax longispinosus TaxID=300112 RepID=A0A4S2JQB9_9HYME|nr:Cytochrome P450 9e2 [Temnothorax longispinosus]